MTSLLFLISISVTQSPQIHHAIQITTCNRKVCSILSYVVVDAKVHRVWFSSSFWKWLVKQICICLQIIFIPSVKFLHSSLASHYEQYIISVSACEDTSMRFLKKEIPVRLANIMKELNHLPKGMLISPPIKRITKWQVGRTLLNY